MLPATSQPVVAALDPNNAPPDPVAAPVPEWIWGPEAAKGGEERYFRMTFDPELPAVLKTENPSSAFIWAACDNEMTIYLNNKQVARNTVWGSAVLVDVRSGLVSGENVLAIRCKNTEGPAGLALKLEIRRQDREPFQLVTGEQWKSAEKAPRKWRTRDTDIKAFTSARVIGKYGIEPWGTLAASVPSQATAVENLTLLPGFKAELVYSVPRGTEGSWVTMTPDPKGRLWVSDQTGPLFRVTLPTATRPILVEPIDLEIGSSQGMLWDADSLYVVVNSKDAKNKSGLYRLRDTNGDDKLDELTLLKSFKDRSNQDAGYGEHGPHAIVKGPDNLLYVVAGNFTSLPDPIAPTSPAKNWAEDLLLERMPDGKGHDPTIMAPASWVCRTDKDGKKWEAIVTGMRNAYDIAFNPDGELFTHDSDMEWDIGAPWYRPTRINHLVSGAELGWRNGSGKWPTYYPDSIPGIADTGEGSPTGIAFGTGAKFPAKYQRALFASDWAYGKIYAVHMEPKGAGYTATYEPFIVGKPFDVTDVVINRDGAMYITIGGRGTQSGLYRITYTGNESTVPAPTLKDSRSAQARALRHKLERFHGRRDPAAVSTAWPYLNSDDRFLRTAARIAIEHQDPSQWTERALGPNPPTTSINALLAVCRGGDKSLQPRVIEALDRLDLTKLTEEQQLEALRAYGLCFIRMGRPTDAVSNSLRSRFNSMFPHKSVSVTHELTELLVYLKSPTVVDKSMKLLDGAQTQEEQLFYAFQIRNLAIGWTPQLRDSYFRWLNRAQQNYRGGASFQLFLKNVRSDAVKTLSEQEKVAYAPLLKPVIEAPPEAAAHIPARKFVRSWTMQDLALKLQQVKSGRSFESGKSAYAAVSCVKCHRFNGEGGASGPDISGVGARFQPADLLESLILPSKIISDQYQATQII
ncbi:MAG: PQQ-dependent sugar dehydrogenase, partial [Gemmatimonadaceae bacterium]|nr:PQQ-dependent sugar dehydrogenase [Gemmatimonadaceae bacterium]